MTVATLFTRWPILALLAIQPLMASCQGSASSNVNEFRLNTHTATDVFGLGVQRDLARAAAKGNATQIMYLIQEQKADPNGEGKETITPVFWAMFAKNYVGLKTLLELGGDPNKPMWLSARKDWPKVERWPLIQAATWQDLQMMEILLKAGANPEIGGTEVSALERAASSIDAVKLLVKYGADVNRRTKMGGATGFMFGNLETIIFVLENGYNQDLDHLMYDVLEHYPSDRDDRRAQQEKILSLLKAKGVKPFVPPWKGTPDDPEFKKFGAPGAIKEKSPSN